MQRISNIPFSDRIRFIGYGLIAGLVIGAILGWWLHAWVGFIVRLGFVVLLLVPVVAAILFWKRVTTKTPPPPDPTVRDADWVEIEPTSRTRR